MPSRRRYSIAIIISVVSAILITPYFLTISDTLSSTSKEYDNLTKPSHPRTFQIPMYLYLTGYLGFAPESDMTITLNLTYPNGTLIADESVTVLATAILHYPAMTAISRVEVGFQNSLWHNATDNSLGYSLWGEPFQGALNFNNWTDDSKSYTDSNNNTYIESAKKAQDDMIVSWSVDGDYKPIIQWFYYNGSSAVAEYSEVVIHVYPKEQLTQIETNEISLQTNMASLKLSQAVLILGAIAIVALIVQILDHTDTQCNYPKDTGNNKYKCPYIEDKRRNRFKVIKEKGKT